MHDVRTALVLCLTVLYLPFMANGARAAGDAEKTIPAAARLNPADLADMLTKAKPPLILQVGSKVMFDEAHIPGAIYAGPAGQAGGIQNLKARVAKLDHRQPIVLYCGCCPWERCPNIAPAYRNLREWGFVNIRVLYLPNNFGQDWIDMGYPAVRS